MEPKSFENKIATIQKPGQVTLWVALFAFLLACVLFGCTTPGSSDPTSVSAPPVAAPSLDNSQSSLVQIQARGVLSVGTAITEPFEYHDPDTGELIGFDVDTAEYIADKLGVKLEWVEMPFANLIPALQDRKADIIIAAMYIKPEREELVDFSEPYINTGLVMAVRPGLQAQVKTVQDLAGLKVGVKIGATGAELAQELIAGGIALESVEYKDTFDSFLDLEVGRVDVVFNDYLNTLVYIKDSQSDLVIVTNEAGEVNFLSQAGLGIAVYQGDWELLDLINAALMEMSQDGSFDRLYEDWLGLNTAR
ncbi:MAG: ABC transporter substrate-binding protein [Chloroflexi bacterium]|nr:ABC transporter substrate-binding protein [Chloroflexota bacterium]